MFLTSKSDRSDATIGSKAERLFLLFEAGYQVPEFTVVAGEQVKALLADASAWDAFPLPKDGHFAVRSAALGEDGSGSSRAGQFKTVLDVPFSELQEAYANVLEDATEKGFGDRFSVIIQRFVSPQHAGVLFTRNPLGGRECVLEYRAGIGDQVVGGGSVERKRFLRNRVEASDTLPFTQELARIGDELEELFAAPQDIEWAFADGGLHILQSRPITNVSADQAEGYQYLDSAVPDRPFVFERTPLTESFARPTPLNMSFLRWLYAAGGPVARAYKECGIKYRPTEQFKVLGNQLFIDKNEETHSLFPAMGYAPGEFQARVLQFRGLLGTLKNFKRLNSLSVKYRPRMVESFESYLTTESEPADIEQALAAVAAQYPLIFRTNLISQLAWARLGKIAGNEAALNELLTACTITPISTFDPTSLDIVGNSISLDDTSPFLASSFREPDEKVRVAELNWKLRGAVSIAENANRWLQLRELGRWVSAKLAHDLRQTLRGTDLAPELAHYASLAEYQQGLPAAEDLQQRKVDFHSYDRFDFPRILARPLPPEDDAQGILPVSPGSASGRLVREADIPEDGQSCVLYVDTLLPSYTRYFANVQGIVSREGGLLSHLAIMARERGLPVIVTEKDLTQYLGEPVLINGTEGDIEFDRP